MNKVYGVMGCTDEQRVLFSSFLMEARAKDWWDSVERRYPDGISVGPRFSSRAYPLDLARLDFLLFGKPFKKTVWSRHLFLFYFKGEKQNKKEKP